MNNNRKFRRCCFTLNNYKDADLTLLDNLYHEHHCNYIIYGKELAPTTQTPHIQGYCEFFKQLRFIQIKNLLPFACHIEPAKGTAVQNINYCMKDDDYTIFGEPKKQGSRSDIITIKNLIDNDKSMNDIISQCSNLQCIKIAEKLIQYKQLSKNYNKPFVYYITGDSGSGKTTFSYSLLSPHFWRNGIDLHWFDGYDNHEEVLINEFRDSYCKLETLLQLLDGYQFRVPIKGGFTIWNPKHIVINSIKKPWELYDSEDENMFQLFRRIDKFVTMSHFKVASEVGGNTIPQLPEYIEYIKINNPTFL